MSGLKFDEISISRDVSRQSNDPIGLEHLAAVSLQKMVLRWCGIVRTFRDPDVLFSLGKGRSASQDWATASKYIDS